MQIKKILSIIKKINHTQLLAVLFLAYIFYVSTVTLPSTIINVGNYLKSEKTDILTQTIAVRDKINDEYKNMLTYRGTYTKNKGAYINLNGLMAQLMGQRYMNECVKLDDGCLTNLLNKQDMTVPSIQLTALYNKQKEKGDAFLFVLAPHQIPKYENILPVGYENYSNENADDLLVLLRENNVPVLDLRDEMLKEGIKHEDAFFKTDHHWKAETGFWAYTKIVDYLTQEKIIDSIDPMYTDINEYNLVIYKNWSLGSFGKRTGSYYAGVDDFTVITPKFETNMSIDIPSKSINRKGTFADVCLDTTSNRLDYFSSNPYEIYGHGNKDFKSYRNESAPINLKALFIGDSFSNTSLTFITSVINSCDQLDMRFYTSNFKEYYEKYDPDIVIVCAYAGGLIQKNVNYDFFGDEK